MKRLAFILLVCWHFSAFGQLPTPGIPQIPVPTLPDAAIATMDQYGHPVIYYNPNTMQALGTLVAYFGIAHEYGHHKLGHILAKYYDANNPYIQAWLTLNMENQADAFAVDYWIQRGDKRPIQAGYNAFVALDNPGDETHPPSAVRAQNIANYFQQRTGMSLFP